MMKLKNQQGFTLIELIIVVVIVALLAAGGSLMLQKGFIAGYEGTDIINANWQAKVTLQRMSRDIRAIRSPSDITTFASGNFVYTDTDGTSITYTTSGSTITRKEGSGTAQTLADGISSLNFYYLTGGMVTAVSAANIRYIRVVIGVNSGGVDYSFSQIIFPRNFA